MKKTERKATKAYLDALGKNVVAQSIIGINKNDESVEITLPEPATFTVVNTDVNDVLRWMDGNVIDSIWALKPLNELPELSGIKLLAAHSHSYHLDGTIEIGDIIHP